MKNKAEAPGVFLLLLYLCLFNASISFTVLPVLHGAVMLLLLLLIYDLVWC